MTPLCERSVTIGNSSGSPVSVHPGDACPTYGRRRGDNALRGAAKAKAREQLDAMIALMPLEGVSDALSGESA